MRDWKLLWTLLAISLMGNGWLLMDRMHSRKLAHEADERIGGLTNSKYGLQSMLKMEDLLLRPALLGCIQDVIGKAARSMPLGKSPDCEQADRILNLATLTEKFFGETADYEQWQKSPQGQKYLKKLGFPLPR